MLLNNDTVELLHILSLSVYCMSTNSLTATNRQIKMVKIWQSFPVDGYSNYRSTNSLDLLNNASQLNITPDMKQTVSQNVFPSKCTETCGGALNYVLL